AINPITDPALDRPDLLTFRNAAVDAGFAKTPDGYRAAWFTFDNATGETRSIGETSGQASPLPVPTALPRRDGVFIRIEISATGGPNPSWQKPLNVYFRQR